MKSTVERYETPRSKLRGLRGTDSQSIKPKFDNRSDFFSWQLFAFVKKHPNYTHIYKLIDTDKANIKGYTLYIGNLTDDLGFVGRDLRRLCYSGVGLNLESMLVSLRDQSKLEDITEKFWADYLTKGVCLIHNGVAHSWVADGNTRTCEYCGETQYKKITMVEKTSWVDEPVDEIESKSKE